MWFNRKRFGDLSGVFERLKIANYRRLALLIEIRSRSKHDADTECPLPPGCDESLCCETDDDGGDDGGEYGSDDGDDGDGDEDDDGPIIR